jgi:peroxiredoxin
MKKQIILVLVLMLFLGGVHSSLAASAPPAKGDPLPAITLPLPKSPEERTYLGLAGEGTFKIPQIKTQVVILEIFSMYCPFCQGEAPSVNELYQLIEENPDLKGKIKIIGLGAGNTPFEVEVFKKKYNVPFPLVADADFKLHKTFGEVRTPYFIAARLQKDKPPQVIYSELGTLNGAKPFLEKLRKLAELN